MNPQKLRLIKSRHVIGAIAWCTLIVGTALIAGPQHWNLHRKHQQTEQFAGKSHFTPVFFHESQAESGEEGILPKVLSDMDRGRYRAIFAAQKKGDWSTADTFIGELENHVLLGTVIADRILSEHYVSSAKELENWLRHYDELPQAPAIYSLALKKDPTLRNKLKFIASQKDLKYYGDSFNISVHSYDTPYSGYWEAGLLEWKRGNRAQAAKHFAYLSSKEEYLNAWMASAAAYWAYRSYDALHDKKRARSYLHRAASYPRTFYGILARKHTDKPLDLDTQPVQLQENDILQMVGDQSVRRVIALTETGNNELAETELRWRFPQADRREKGRLLALAHELGLASVQMSMAHILGVDGRELDFARYPVPNWQPRGGYKVDPLLIFSLMRQESGFRSSAVSGVGAMGLMQLMPQTASMVHKKMYGDGRIDRARAEEPIMNLTLGQDYVASLLQNPLVEGNLVYMLVAYNAGAGRLQNWKKDLHSAKDPLLFIESIPFNETRTYVLQVMTNYWVYAELLGSEEPSVYALMQGKWPSYAGMMSADTEQAASTQRSKADPNGA